MIQDLFNLLSIDTSGGEFEQTFEIAPVKGLPIADITSIEEYFSSQPLADCNRVITGNPVDEPVSLDNLTIEEVGCCHMGEIHEDKIPQTANLQAQLMDFFAKQQQPQSLPKAVSELEKEAIGVAIVELEDAIAAEGSFAVIDKTLCHYCQPCWSRLIDKEQAQAEVRQWIADNVSSKIPLRPRYVKELVEALKTDPRLKKSSSDFASRELLINCADGVYDIMTGKTRNHSPSYGFFSYINISAYAIGTGSHDYYDEFVNNAFADDWNAYQLSKEIIGVVLSNLDLKQFYVAQGETQTGKSQFGLFLQKLLGDDLVESVSSIDDFGDNWTTGKLYGKRLCTCLDLPDTYLPKRVISVVKQLVGDDSVRGQLKYINPFSFYPDTVLFFATNHLLKVPNIASEKAFLSRLTVLPFKNSVPEELRVKKLYLKLLDEAPFIVGEAVKAVRDLVSRNYVHTVAVPTYEAIYSPELSVVSDCEGDIKRFVESQCIFGSDLKTTTSALHNAYCEYCEEWKLQAVNLIDFARKLLVLYPELQTLKRVDGKDQRGIQGISPNRYL
jgi:P4 family phage/plasmid primase-like protien